MNRKKKKKKKKKQKGFIFSVTYNGPETLLISFTASKSVCLLSFANFELLPWQFGAPVILI
jgi:hypothetical protein